MTNDTQLRACKTCFYLRQPTRLHETEGTCDKPSSMLYKRYVSKHWSCTCHNFKFGYAFQYNTEKEG